MTDTRTDLEKQSDAQAKQRLLDAGLVPVVYPEPMGAVQAGAIFWILPDKKAGR